MERVDVRLSESRQALESRAKPDDELQAQLATVQQTLRDRIAVQRTIDRELVELRARVKEADGQLANIRRTLAFQLGQILIQATTFKGFFTLPFRIYGVVRSFKRRRVMSPRSSVRRPSLRMLYVAETLRKLEHEGQESALAHAIGLPDRNRLAKVRALTELAHAICISDPQTATAIGCAAAALEPAETQLRTLAFTLYGEGHVRFAAQILDGASAEISTTQAQRARAASIRADFAELDAPFPLPPATAAIEANGQIAIIASRSLPNHADAATYRAQAMAEDVAASGRSAVIITEPGYSYPAKGDGLPQTILVGDGIALLRLPPSPSNEVNDVFAWTSDAIEQELQRRGVGFVVIAAEPQLALAAAAAAQRCGIAYALDIGAIPLAGGANRDDWQVTERFAASWSRLRTVARSANRVIVRSAALGATLEANGFDLDYEVRGDRLHSSIVSASAAVRRDIRRELGATERQPLIGIVSEVAHERRLLELVRMLPRVRAQVPEAAVVFCGPGRTGQAIRREAAMLGVPDAVFVPDGFVRQRLGYYICTFNAMLFPAQHCEPGLSAPLELQVALAMGTPVIAIDSPWSSELLAHGDTIAPNDEAALVEAVVRALDQHRSE